MDIPKFVILILSFIYNYSIKESLDAFSNVSLIGKHKISIHFFIYKLYSEKMKRQNKLS